MERKDKGILIAFEGIDGAGKTTQVELLTDFLDSVGQPVVRSKEPTEGPWGQLIRQWARNGRSTLDEEVNAFVKDREEHVREVILPALAKGKIVLLDRYFYSTIAYQGARSGDIDSITSKMLDISPEPDAVVLIDVPPELGLARIEQGRGEKPNAFEKKGTLEQVRDVFLQLARQRPNIILIDGTPSIEVVRRAILESLLKGVLRRYNATP